jgi:hypothetical protein
MRSRVGLGNFKTTILRQEERQRQWLNERSGRDSKRGEKWPYNSLDSCKNICPYYVG